MDLSAYSRAAKRMDGEDVFGHKITATMMGDTSSDEGYGTPAAKSHSRVSSLNSSSLSILSSAPRNSSVLKNVPNTNFLNTSSQRNIQTSDTLTSQSQSTHLNQSFSYSSTSQHHSSRTGAHLPLYSEVASHLTNMEQLPASDVRGFQNSNSQLLPHRPSLSRNSFTRAWASHFVAQQQLSRPPTRVTPFRSLSANCFAQNNTQHCTPRPVSTNPLVQTAASSNHIAPPPTLLPHPSQYLTDSNRGRLPRKITRRHSVPNENESSEESSSDRSASSYSEGGVDLVVYNLPPLDPVALRKSLEVLFSEYVKVVRLVVGGLGASGDGLMAVVTLRDEASMRLAVSRLHRRHWCGRRLILCPSRPAPTADRTVVRARLRHLLEAVPDRSLPLLRLRELYSERFGHPLSSSELGKAHDMICMCDSPNGRRVILLSSATSPDPGLNLKDSSLVPRRCETHDKGIVTDVNGDSALSLVYMSENALSRGLSILLTSHEGVLPLASLHACYASEFEPLPIDVEHGVYLELLVRTIPSVCIMEQPVRHITWTRDSQSMHKNKDFASIMELVSQHLTALLIIQSRCCILFNKLVPAYHNHFGRQLRVADFGFTRLSDLLDALSDTVVVLGSGHGRMVTLSPSAQAKRFASDTCKVLKKIGRSLEVPELQLTWNEVHGSQLNLFDYGACDLNELVTRAINTHRYPISMPSPGILALTSPFRFKRSRLPQTVGVEPLQNFANEAVLLLSQIPNMTVELSRFVPAYHALFGRQCHVGNYGCMKLVELLEKCPQLVIAEDPERGERQVRLAPDPMKEALQKRIAALTPVHLSNLSTVYCEEYAAPLPVVGDVVNMIKSLELEIRAGLVIMTPAVSESLAQKALISAACLPSDLCVGGEAVSLQLFERAYADIAGALPPLEELRVAGVLETKVEGDRVALSKYWRVITKIASLLAGYVELTSEELSARWPGSSFPIESVVRAEPGIFEEQISGRFRLKTSLALHAEMIAPPTLPLIPDIGLDTPPGQQGSRVFESPAASSVPFPSYLLKNDHNRRRRLAPFFGSTNISN